MELSVLTPHRKLLDHVQVDEVVAPGFAGTLELLEGHANFVTTLETGVLKWKTGQSWDLATVSSGILEVHNGHVSVMADVSELSHEIDVNRAKTAKETARAKIEEGGLDDVGLRKFELKLARALSRLNASGEEK